MQVGGDKLYLYLIRFIEAHGLIGPGDGVLVCVSGGSDSVGLLHLLARAAPRWNLRLEVAHFDHRLRGRESQEDAAFVAGLAAELGLECHLGRWEGASQAGKGSLQARARDARYAFFFRIARERGLGLVATAHTADDQAEELLLRLLRGASLQGLSGIPLKGRNGVIRPLLFASKQEIRSYLKDHGLEWREDSSNLSEKYLRNRIRRRLIPLLRQEFNPAVVEALCRTASNLAEAQEALALMAHKVLNKALLPGFGQGKVGLSIHVMGQWPPAVRKEAYKLALERVGAMNSAVAKVHLDGIDEIVSGPSPSAEIHLPGGMVRRAYGELWFFRGHGEPLEACGLEPLEMVIPSVGEYGVPGAGVVVLRYSKRPQRAWKRQKAGVTSTLAVDADSCPFPLELRFRRPGDRFQPLGMEQEIPLKRFLMARRVPRPLRWRLPLLFSQGRMVCVCGVEVAQWARITSSTVKVLEIQWRPQDSI